MKPLNFATRGFLASPISFATRGYLNIVLKRNGGLRFYPANEPVTNELIERIKRDDEELIAIVSVIGEIIL